MKRVCQGRKCLAALTDSRVRERVRGRENEDGMKEALSSMIDFLGVGNL